MLYLRVDTDWPGLEREVDGTEYELAEEELPLALLLLLWSRSSWRTEATTRRRLMLSRTSLTAALDFEDKKPAEGSDAAADDTAEHRDARIAHALSHD